MKHLLGPQWMLQTAVLAACLSGSQCALAQSGAVMTLVQETNPLILLHASSQGYLGVEVADVDNDKAQALKLKEVRGALITLIDHDAPAGKAGLRANDVVLQLNGQPVEGAEQLRRMLREIPAQHKVSLQISRDGSTLTIEAQLVDRRVMESQIWGRRGVEGDGYSSPGGMAILSGGGGDTAGSGPFHMPFVGSSSLNVGALVEPLSAQLAEFIGVPSGIIIKQVARKSDAATAGLKQHDVILKVGAEAINTTSDWERALRVNQGRAVQVTVLRDKKQQTLTLQVDSRHKQKQGQINTDAAPGEIGCNLLAGGDELALNAMPEAMRQLQQSLSDASAVDFKALQDQADTLRDEAQKLKEQLPQIMNALPTQKDAEQLRKMSEDLHRQFGMDDDALRALKRQLEEMKALGFGDHI